MARCRKHSQGHEYHSAAQIELEKRLANDVNSLKQPCQRYQEYEGINPRNSSGEQEITHRESQSRLRIWKDSPS